MSVQTGYMNPTVQVEEAAFSILYYYVCAPLLTQAKKAKSPLDMNFYYECAINQLTSWSHDPFNPISGQEFMWEGAKGPSLYDHYMQSIRDKYSGNGLLINLLKEMVTAGCEKLRSHAEEHLPGGIYATPSEQAVQAANTIGDATNDVIESTFGMLDRQLMIAPSSNAVNVSSLIAAKRDKPVNWILKNNLDCQKLCNVAMKSAKRKRNLFGTKNEQTKKRFLSVQPERLAIIKKRRLNREKRAEKLKENLKKAKSELCKDCKLVKKMKKQKFLNNTHYGKLYVVLLQSQWHVGLCLSVL